MKLLMAIITAMFVGAKLAHVISWSWWIVFSPVMVYVGLIILIFIIAFIVQLFIDV